MVIDASALLAVLFNEATADWCLQQLVSASSPLIVSSVTLTKC